MDEATLAYWQKRLLNDPNRIFEFVMESDGVSFPEAVERLAQMVGRPEHDG